MVSITGGTAAPPKRRRLRFVPLIALALGLAEIAVFTVVAGWVGVPFAVLAVVALSALGVVLLKREGVRGWRRLRAAARDGVPAGAEAVAGVVGVGAALLLMAPGFLTGLAGLVLLIPPVRRFTAGRMRVATEKRVSSSTAGDLFGPRQVRVQRVKTTTTPPDDEVVEGEIVD